MDRATEVALLEELQGLKDNGLFFLDDDVKPSPIARYTSADRFSAEMDKIFRTIPVVAAHASELPDPGSFLTRTVSGRPVLMTRDRDGTVHAFLNVCRHRGARLVDDAQGCKHMFSCPYHAWTWTNKGNLRGIPHEKQGFPGIDKTQHGLVRLPATERAGLIWVVADSKAEPDFSAHIDPIAEAMEWCDMADLAVVHTDTITRNANWKLLVEGGIEAYHFKVAHKNTIGPHFLDNLSSYAMLGPHMRSILPRNTLTSLSETPQDAWAIRDHANVLYTLFPLTQFLLMQDHIAWINLSPLAADRTELRLTTLAPKSEVTPEKAEHWARNHKITSITLDEDFEINEAVQAGLTSGANTHHMFGAYEGALNSFNATVERFQ